MTERVILESEVFMTDTKKNTLTILAVVLTIAVIFSACTSIFTAKAVYDLRAEAKAQTETQEDGVVILDQYEIVSTLPISEAYRSGNTNGLSAKDKETLELASAVLKEIITEDMTPYEKEKAVYDWMAKELSYDTGALQVVPQTSADCDNPYGTLKYHNAVCVGYATPFCSCRCWIFPVWWSTTQSAITPGIWFRSKATGITWTSTPTKGWGATPIST